MVKERDQMISDLKVRSSEQQDRFARSSDQQRAALEQHYRQIINEISSRNEVLAAL